MTDNQNEEETNPMAPEELLQEMVMSLVSKPEEVWIETNDKPDGFEMLIHSNSEDHGVLFGKDSKTLTAIRMFMNCVAYASNRRFRIFIKTDKHRTRRVPSNRRDSRRNREPEITYMNR